MLGSSAILGVKQDDINKLKKKACDMHSVSHSVECLDLMKQCYPSADNFEPINISSQN